MSQWGAYGAAKVAHMSSNQILHFYYPHTTLATRSTARTIRVLLTAADASARGYLQVNPATGLARDAGQAARPLVLPTESAGTARDHRLAAAAAAATVLVLRAAQRRRVAHAR